MVKMEEYIESSIETPIRVRFRDTDAMGHVNNAVFLTYLELARIDYFFNRFKVVKPLDLSFILARVEIDFKRPITMADNPLVQVWVSRIGKSSWSFSYRITDKKDKTITFALANSVQVAFDYKKNTSIPLPQEFKDQLMKDLKQKS